MLYKFTPFGYFGRVAQTSRGPWWQEYMAEEDGLEIFYTFIDNTGAAKYLLSNNMSYDDRTAMFNLWNAHKRANLLATAASCWISVELVLRLQRFRGMAIGWKALSVFGMTIGIRQFFNAWNSQTYQPLIGAYIRKY